jgi:hypothetical protein
VSREQLREIERLVNREIRENHTVETRIMDLEDAKASGAMALFGEKYAEQVRVLRMGDFLHRAVRRHPCARRRRHRAVQDHSEGGPTSPRQAAATPRPSTRRSPR